METSIYDLELHRELNFYGFYVIRVPGGWVYVFNTGHSVFVPYNDEFKP